MVDHAHGLLGITLSNLNGKPMTPETMVDLCTDAARQGDYLCYVSPRLPRDYYQITARVTGLKSKYAGGSYGVIDRFAIEP